MRVALSEKLREDGLTVVDAVKLEQPKTKLVEKMLASLEIERSALIVDDASNQNLRRAARNHPRVKVVSPTSLNVYDVLLHDRLVVSRDSVARIAEIFKP